MKTKKGLKQMTAWALSVAMVLGNGSFTVLAEDWQDESELTAEVEQFAEEQAEKTTEEMLEEPAGEETEESLKTSEVETESETEEEPVAEEFWGEISEEFAAEDSATIPEFSEKGEDGNSIGFCNLRGEGHTWMFTDEDYVLELDTSSLEVEEEKELTAEWSVKTEGENGDFTEIVNNPEESAPYYEEVYDNGYLRIILHGAALKTQYNPGEGSTFFEVSAVVKCDDTEIADANVSVEMINPWYDYEWPLSGPGECQLFPGDTADIPTKMNAWGVDKDHPTGANFGVDITDVKILKQGDEWEDGELIGTDVPRVALEGDSENGWKLYAENGGSALVQITYTSPETRESDKYKFYVHVTGERYRLDWYYPNDNDCMLPDSTMEIRTRLVREWHDWEGKREEEDVKGYTLKVTDEYGYPNYDSNLISVTVESIEDGTQMLRVESNSNQWGTNIHTSVLVDGGEVIAYDPYVNVTNQYDNIVPVDWNEAEGIQNPNLGESLNLNQLGAKVIRTSAGEIVDLIDREDVRIRLLEYDKNVWDIKEGTGDDLIPTLIRKSTDGTGVTLIAEEWTKEFDEEGNEVEVWRELTRRTYWFDGVWYDIRLTARYDERRTNNLYTDTPVTVEIENILQEEGSYPLPDGYETEWEIKKPTEESEEDCSEVKCDEIDQNTARLTVIDNNFRDKDIIVYIYVTYMGQRIAQADTWLWVMDPEYDYSYPCEGPGGDQCFPGEGRDIPTSLDCYVRDSSYPEGENIEVPVTDVKILKQGYDWDENGELIDDPYKVPRVTVEGDSENGWTLHAENGGSALVQITYESAETGDTEEYEFYVHVTGERYRLEWSYPNDIDCMLTNSSMLIETRLVKEMYDWEDGSRTTEYVEEYTLEVTDDKGNPMYDSDLIKVDNDNKLLYVYSNENKWGTNIHVRVLAAREEGEEAEEVIAYDLWVNVTDEYYDLQPKNVNVIVHEGETISDSDLGVKLIRYNKENPGGEEVSEAVFRFSSYHSDYLTVSEDGTKLYAAESIPDEMASLWSEMDAFVQVNGWEEYIGGKWISITPHKWDKGTVKVSPTCTGNGQKEYHCTVEGCNETKTETIYSTGHTLTHHSAVSATCTTSGTIEYWSCKNCGKNFSDAAGTHLVTNLTTSALSHTGGTATCTEQAKCTRCGAAYGEKLPHTIVTVVDSQPICGTPGKQHSECSVCHGERTELEDIPATGEHTFGEWAAVTEATVSAPEVQKRTCSVCGYEETKELGEKLAPLLGIPGKLSSFNILNGETVSFAVTMAKGDALASCTSSKKSVVKVAGVDKTTGTISLKAVKSGTANITITLASGMTKTYPVKVTNADIKTSKIALSAKEVTLEKGKTFKLTATLKPFTSTQKVTYTTSDKNVARVSSTGRIRAIAPGTATITAVSGSKKATCKVTVAGIANVKSSVTVAKGKTLTLKPAVYGITDKVTYTTSSKKIATVSSKGKIKGIKKGTATITVTAGKYTVECKVKVQ